MLKEEIKYTDYNGVERTFVAYFNLTKPEMVRLQASVPEGYQQYLMDIMAAKDMNKLIEAYEHIIHMSYGQKSEDGLRFIKSEELWEAFEQSPAYEELYVRLLTDEDYAVKFMENVTPKADAVEKTVLPA